MTNHTPLTEQQLTDIEALTKNIPAGPWTVDDSHAELRGSHSNLLADLWDDRLGAYFVAMHSAMPALLAEVRHLRAVLDTEKSAHLFTLRQRNNRSRRLTLLHDLALAGDVEQLLAAAKDTLAASIDDHIACAPASVETGE